MEGGAGGGDRRRGQGIKDPMGLSELLANDRSLDAGRVRACVDEHERTGRPLTRLVVERGLLPESALLSLLSREWGLPMVSVEDTLPDPELIRLVPARVAGHYRCVPLSEEAGRLRLALSLPADRHVADELQMVLQRDVDVSLASSTDVQKAIKAAYGIGAETLEKLAGHEREEEASRAPADLDAADDASVIKLVNQIFLEACDSRATDIHLEPYPDEYRVRYRIDGVLYDAHISDRLKKLQSAVISRIKIMAEMSISEKRLPQDGRIEVRVGGKSLDMRVSTMPTPHGEGLVIRLLSARELLDLGHLGFFPEDVEKVKPFLTAPHGILFLTGPTGSGKTTTLYAFLREINGPDKKIITMEDPIEYRMKGITQVQVQPAIGLTFASGLRSMLRHDPDVMMVGEVRDLETAEIAIRVSLTGHLVFSTLHTNDAAGAVTRLLDLGLEPYLVSSSVLGIIAQRLVRLLCPQCKESSAIEPGLRAEFDLRDDEMSGEIFKARGCRACNQSGFRGRTVIYEVLPLTPAVKTLVMSREPANLIREKAVQEGMRTLRRCGWEKVRRGVTTPDEVVRVTIRD